MLPNTPPSTPIVPVSPLPQSPPKTPTWKYIIIVVVTMLVALGATYLLLLKFSPPKSSEEVGSETITETSEEDTASIIIDVYRATHALKDGKSTVGVPAEWTIIDNSEQLDVNGILTWFPKVVIKNGDYQVASTTASSLAPQICLFPDNPQFLDSKSVGIKYEEYKAFTGNGGEEYRFVSSPSKSDPGKLTWTICKKEINSNNFTTFSGFGVTTFVTPLQYDEIKLQAMEYAVLDINKGN